MAQINPTLPTVGDLNSTADPEILTALSTIISTIDALGTDNLADGIVTDVKLAASAASQWRDVGRWTYQSLQPGTAMTFSVEYAMGVIDALNQCPGAESARGMIYVDPADYALTGKTTQFRLAATLVSGNNPLDTGLTFKLRRATGVGNDPTLGVSTVAAADISLSTSAPGTAVVRTVSGGTALASAGGYVITVTHPGTSAGKYVTLDVRLQVRAQ